MTESGMELEKYRLDRQHELELDKFAHVLEIERLKVLSYLNGGAVGVYLALMKDRLTGAESGLMIGSIAAVLFWSAGLCAAALAIQLNLRTQVAFAKAYRNRRRATEWRLFKRSGLLDDSVRRRIGSPPDPPETYQASTDGDRFDEAASYERGQGDRFTRCVKSMAIVAVLSFVLGALCATVSVGRPALVGEGCQAQVLASPVQWVGSTWHRVGKMPIHESAG